MTMAEELTRMRDAQIAKKKKKDQYTSQPQDVGQYSKRSRTNGLDGTEPGRDILLRTSNLSSIDHARFQSSQIVAIIIFDVSTVRTVVPVQLGVDFATTLTALPPSRHWRTGSAIRLRMMKVFITQLNILMHGTQSPITEVSIGDAKS